MVPSNGSITKAACTRSAQATSACLQSRTRYVKDPYATLVVSPDNDSRQDLNNVIHRVMQREGHVRSA